MKFEIRAVGLNYRDLLTALGRLQNADIGCECAGIVTKAGEGVRGLKVGDRVAVLPAGCYRSYLSIDHRLAAHIPDAVSFTTAAAMLINHFTAWSAFSLLARLGPGETALVHSAAGGTGQAAIQVAQHLGAKVIATAGTVPKKEMLVDRYGIDPEHIFSSRDPVAFSRGVTRATGGRGRRRGLELSERRGIEGDLGLHGATWAICRDRQA